jgi:SAM-dependent methyltransferase
MKAQNLDKAASHGEPSYVWREGQQRRLEMIVRACGARLSGRVLENGCGIGLYAEQLAALGGQVVGLEYDFDRSRLAAARSVHTVNAAGEHLPFPAASFDMVLSHEVIEHVQDDRASVSEMIRALKSGGRVIIFCPNRGYPFETHGIYWAGKYHFGNQLFINYLPRVWRDRLAPHVRAYAPADLRRLLEGLPVQVIVQTVIFGGYDNIVGRYGVAGRIVRAILQFLERTPLRVLGLSHFWVIEKT